MKYISIRGARVHNLKSVDVDLPRDRLVVITGLSGSGKSSLAFDTLYAEGQRRYVETLSPYARQFLEQMGKPDVDSIDGLSPAISIEQRSVAKNPRSTVGTMTEIYDYLRLLYARVGTVHCVACGQPIAAQTVQQMVDRVLALPEGTRFSVLAPLVRARTGDLAPRLAELRKQGFVRANVDGQLVDLAEPPPLDPGAAHTLEVYVDRLVLKEGIRQRLTDSVETAARLAGGLVKVAPLDGNDLVFSERFACIDCGTSFPEITPRLFSFNNPQGACPACDGIGARLFFDPELVVPDPDLSLREGAIDPWEKRSTPFYTVALEALAAHYGFDMLAPWRTLPEAIRRVVLYGTGGEEIELSVDKAGERQSLRREFDGVIPMLERRLADYERRRREEASRQGGAAAGEPLEAAYEEFHRYMNRSPCEACGATRLRAEARAVKLGGRAIYEVSALPIKEVLPFFEGLVLGPRDREVAERPLRDLVERLRFLGNVGLEYLSLDRTTATLSGGEAQRIRLATQIGAGLVGVLYILDEPSIGLHQRDNERLIATLTRLRDRGNTVIVVEHDEDTIRAADWVVDMGPRAGVHGGQVVVAGTPDEVAAAPQSLTGAYLSGRRRIEVPAHRRVSQGRWIELRGARANNLRNVHARFPIGRFTCVTGVSGSGKSSLVIDTLLPALAARLHGAHLPVGDHDALEGAHHADKVVDIDQSPIGRTPRSNPATYTGLFTLIRDLFAGLPESRARGYRAGRYSFNVKGGRCEACQGDGILRIEMHFLPDVYVVCESCAGRRYNRETLEVRYKGASIADVLDMTVAQAAEFLAHIPKVRPKLETLRDVGLGYVALGQPATTLSGGEAQRIKLSKELARKGTGQTVYILDEPTTGLHFEDIRQLLHVLGLLVEQGNTVVVIEHNLDVIKSADWVIDLGPEGGDRGGEIVASGTPEEVARAAASHTGRYLRRALAAG
jgi:excinuclease ABC subunit A